MIVLLALDSALQWAPAALLAMGLAGGPLLLTFLIDDRLARRSPAAPRRPAADEG